jgi:hypothetical protein
MTLCVRCGATDRYPSGRCRPCNLARCRARASKPCRKCGTMGRAPSGHCRTCFHTWADKRRNDPCRKCGVTDRNSSGVCRPCQLTIDRACRQANPDKARAVLRRKRTGWTPAMVDFAWELQNGRCRVCDKALPSKQKAQADHCHDTRNPRWLLCRGCNHLEGNIRKVRANGPDIQRIDAYYVAPTVVDVMTRQASVYAAKNR